MGEAPGDAEEGDVALSGDGMRRRASLPRIPAVMNSVGSSGVSVS